MSANDDSPNMQWARIFVGGVARLIADGRLMAVLECTRYLAAELDERERRAPAPAKDPTLFFPTGTREPKE